MTEPATAAHLDVGGPGVASGSTDDRPTTAATDDVLTKEQLDERIKRLMSDLSALHPELTDALEDAVWLRYGIDL